MHVEIYGKPGCQHCNMAKMKCEAEDLAYEYKDIVDDSLKTQLFERLDTPPRSVPQIFIDGAHIGGYSEFNRHLNKRK